MREVSTRLCSTSTSTSARKEVWQPRRALEEGFALCLLQLVVGDVVVAVVGAGAPIRGKLAFSDLHVWRA